MGLLNIIGIGIAGIVLVGILVLGYFGFVPGLSSIMGASSPADLGIKYTSADLASANSKLGVNVYSLGTGKAPKDSLKISGSKAVTASLTDEELTALVNDHSGKWEFYPINDFQIKIGEDGKIQASGVIDLSRLQGYADSTDVSDEEKKQIMDYIRMFQADPKFYVEGDLGVANGQFEGDVDKLSLGNIDAPKDQIDKNKGMITDLIEDRIAGAGVSVENANFDNGQLNFEGTVPSEVGFSS